MCDAKDVLLKTTISRMLLLSMTIGTDLLIWVKTHTHRLTDRENLRDTHTHTCVCETLHHRHHQDKMNTNAGRAMAQHRHVFMEHFLQEFHNEWDGTL